MIWYERLYMMIAFSWLASCKARVSSNGTLLGALPHIPDSKPTEKQLESLLKATDRTAVGEDDSIGGRTFIAVRAISPERNTQ